MSDKNVECTREMHALNIFTGSYYPRDGHHVQGVRQPTYRSSDDSSRVPCLHTRQAQAAYKLKSQTSIHQADEPRQIRPNNSASFTLAPQDNRKYRQRVQNPSTVYQVAIGVPQKCPSRVRECLKLFSISNLFDLAF